MDGVNGPNSRVHIWQTLKQVVVQRCGLTGDRKTAPRPPAPAHPRQSQYMWTLKMHAPGIHLPERGRTCATQDARSFALMCAFVEALLPRLGEQPPKTTLEAKNHEKTLTVAEALFRRESVPLSIHGCMEGMAIKQHSF
jgi:hypothetical protein